MAEVVGEIRFLSPSKFEIRLFNGLFAGQWLPHEATPETAEFIRQEWERQEVARTNG